MKPNRGHELLSRFNIYKGESLTLERLIVSTESLADDLQRVRDALSRSIEVLDEMSADRCLRKIDRLEPQLVDMVQRTLKLHRKLTVDFATLETLVYSYRLSHSEQQLVELLGSGPPTMPPSVHADGE